jgi:hypothetical protein
VSEFTDLAVELERLRMEVRSLKAAPQLASSSIEDGSLDVNDAGGNLVAQVGRQFDGTFMAASLAGPVPPAPTDPLVDPVVGGVIARWDGEFDQGVMCPMDFARVELHATTDPEPPEGWWLTADTLVGTIETPRGSSITLAMAPVPVTFVLVTRSLAGKFSAPSPTVVTTPLEAWSAEQISDIVLASANGKNKVTFSDDAPGQTPNTEGDTWFQYDAADNIVGQWRGLGGTEWTAVALSHEVMSSLDLGKATVGRLNGGMIEAGTITADLFSAVIALVTKIASAETGRRWEADPDGIRVIDGDGTILINFPTDPNVPASITADLVASSLTVVDQLAIRGLNNEISKGATVYLATGTTAPSGSPSVTLDWENYPCGAGGSYASFNPYRYGLARWQNKWVTIQQVYGGSATVNSYGDNGADSALPSPVATDLGAVGGGCTVLGNTLYVLGAITDANFVTRWYVEGYNTAGARVSKWEYPRYSGDRRPHISNDGTNLVIALTGGGNVVLWRKFNPATGAQVGSNVVTTYALAKDLAGFFIGNADFGAARYLVVADGGSTAIAFDASGNRIPNDDFPLASTGTQGLAWDGTRFATLDSAGVKLYYYAQTKWTTESGNWWVSATWWDSNSAGTGTHETAQGPRKPFGMKKRARLNITAPPIPARPVPNTADDAVAARLYIGRGAADPGRTNMERVATLPDGQRNYVSSNVVLPAGAATSPPPAASNFPASTPARILSADGSTLVVNGDGSFNLGGLVGDAAGNTTATLLSLLLGSTTSTTSRILTTAKKATSGANYYESRRYLYDGGAVSGLAEVLWENGSEVVRTQLTPAGDLQLIKGGATGSAPTIPGATSKRFVWGPPQTYTASTVGGTTGIVTIPHGLGVTPSTYFAVQAGSTGSSPLLLVSLTGTANTTSFQVRCFLASTGAAFNGSVALTFFAAE